MVNQATGATLLTPECMEFRTSFRRRSVPWSEVARVEKRCRTRRSGTWSEVRVLRVQGRVLTVPGAFTARDDPAVQGCRV
ncbi:PH domain-containing protein [Streptomyces aquilus]|uniref:PH domain-containing protein n=1 Tax=Streptomyces aquilus TaxID=2548456 RepID=UPI0036A87EE7